MAVNAKAVVDIEVNDKAFKAFQESFDKYAKLLGKTPAAWKAMSTEQKAMAQSFNQGIAALMAQNEVMRKMSAHAKDVSTHFGGALKHVTHMGHRITEVGHGVLHITEKLMKWGAILGGLATGTTLAGFFGFDRLGEFVRSGSISGGRANMSMGSMRALQTEFGENYGVNMQGVGEAGARAAGDPTSEAYQTYRRLGVDPRALKGGEREIALMRAIRGKLAEGYSPARLARDFPMGSVGWDEGGIAVLGNDTGFEDKAKHFGKHASQLDMKQEEINKWTEFMTKLKHATEQLQTILVQYLTPILNVFTANSETWLKNLDKFLKSEAMTKFITDLPGHLETIWAVTKGFAAALTRLADRMGWLGEKYGPNLPDDHPEGEGDFYGGLTKLGQRVRSGVDTVNSAGVPTMEAIRNQFGWFNPFGRRSPEENPMGRLPTTQGSGYPGYAGGTDIGGVPETGIVKLHKGEIVIPAHQAAALRGSGIDDWKRAISGIESGGNYGIMNTRGSGATGKYQVMPENIGPWTKRVFGRAMSQAEFRASPHVQERVFETIFSEYVQKFGNPVDAASAWFSGGPLSGNRAGPDIMGTSVPGYVQSFIRAITGGGIGGRMSLNINDNTGGNVALSAASLPSSTGPLPAFPL